MKDFFKKHKIKKSFRVVIFFICMICLSFGGYTVCKLLFDGNTGSYWNGSVATSFASGTGTQSNPYIINTPAQFAYLQTGCQNNVYVKIANDIYLNEGYIEKEENNYYLYVGNDKYNLNIDTGVATKGISTKTLKKYISSASATSCHIDGNNKKIYGLYIQEEGNASFLQNFTGTIENLYFQSSLINGATATLIKNTTNSTFNDIYFDGHLVSGGEAQVSSPSETLFNQILMDATGEATPEAAMTEISAKGDPNYATYSQYTDEGMYKTLDDNGDTYYYRGNINYNHVLFGEFCWRIVRTTGTGGVKLIYDGIPDNGTCNNTGDATEIGKSQFNDSTDHSIAYAGYMYGEARPTNVFYVEKSPTNVKFSRYANYSKSTKKYSLNTNYYFEMIPTNWGNKFNSSVNAGQVYDKHYTCLNDQTSCNPIYYVTTITSTTSSTDPLADYPMYYQTLSNGETIANLLDTMVTSSSNTTSSTAKEEIDAWFEENLLEYESYLEDAIYCSNREIIQKGAWTETATNHDAQLTFGGYQRNYYHVNRSLLCPSQNDKFTVDSSIGNGSLTYPVGLLTLDEMTYAGHKYTSGGSGGNTANYLYTQSPFWTMTPFYDYSSYNNVNIGVASSTVTSSYANESKGLRPVISLANNVIVASGNGTNDNPYTVELLTENQETSGYSSLIGTSSNSNYSIIRMEGNIDAEYNGASLIYNSTSDNINNIQVNMDANVKNFAPFVSDGTSTIDSVYYKGNIEAENANLFMSNHFLNENVYVLGTINNDANINANCEEVYCTGYNYQNLVDNYNYLPESTIIARLNSSVALMYWKTQSGKLPELMVSGDGGNPIFYATISTTTQNDQVREYTTINLNATRDVLTSKSAPQINVNSIEDTTVIKKIQYYIGNCHPLTESELKANEDIEWIDYYATITLSERGSYIVYFKVTDINNNVGYFTTHYIIYDQLNSTYYNGDTGISLLGNSIDKNTILEVDYKTLGNSPLSNFTESSAYKIKINSLPIGTVLYFKTLRPGNYYENYIYSYIITGEESGYVDLNSFKLSGIANRPTYDTSTLDLKNTLTLYYNFANTNGGTFDAQLVLKDNTYTFLESNMPTNINIINQTDAITLSNNKTTTIPLNTIGSNIIRYTATSSNTEGYYYLKFNVLDSNNNIMDASLMKGLSITYDSVEYLPNNGGTIIVPIGTFKSTMNIVLNTNYLISNLIPGTYFIGAQLYNERASSTYNKFSISTNYITDGRLKNLVEIQRENHNIVTPGSEFRYIITNNIGLLPEYQNASIYPYMELYKKDFNLGNYNSININNYLNGSSFTLTGTNNEVYTGQINPTYIAVPWSNSLTPGAYRLDVRIKINNIAVIKEESLYFVVTGD